jgi:hypothetical protein
MEEEPGVRVGSLDSQSNNQFCWHMKWSFVFCILRPRKIAGCKTGKLVRLFILSEKKNSCSEGYI